MALPNGRVFILSVLIIVTILISLALAADSPPFFLEKRATPTTCSVTVKTPPPTRLVCNKEGSIRSPAPIETIVAKSLPICRDSCLNNRPQCISFSYGPNTKCITYSETIRSSGFQRGPTRVTFWNRHCFSKKCGLCPDLLSPCGGFCYNLQTDNSHCGKCTKTCQFGSTCQSASCLCPNGDSPSLCSGSCPNYQTDNDNCGNCGNVCQHDTTCSQGHCVCSSGQLGDDNNCGTCGNVCTQGTACTENQCICPSGQLGDNNNCGNCSNICQHGTNCSEGQCVCPSGQLGDNNNCGNCSNACQHGTTCSEGQCVCPSGQLGDNKNCGTCDNVCLSGSTCQSGICKCADGSDSSGLQSNNQDCGTCGNVCQFGSTCQSGTCKCADGAAVSSLQTNINDCGTCGNKCIGSGTTCSTGQCMCSDASKTYCPQVGCTSTLSFNYDSRNCGGCGKVCANGQICSQGSCIADPGACNNRGVQWAYLANIDGDNNSPTYSNFKPEHYSSGQPILYNGQIQQIGPWTENGDKIYNTALVAGAANYVMNHRGYIFAPLSGSYTVTIGQFVDDIVCFWIYASAYSGYTRDNAAICRSAGIDNFSGPHQTTISLVAGTYYPFRVMFAQAQENVYFTFDITHTNSGLSIISGTPNSANPWVIQQGCAGTPPAFKPFGSES